jgi:hypothetical protein
MCSIEPSPQFVVTLITDVWGAGGDFCPFFFCFISSSRPQPSPSIPFSKVQSIVRCFLTNVSFSPQTPRPSRERWATRFSRPFTLARVACFGICASWIERLFAGVIPEVDCTPMKMVGVQLNISVLTVKATFDSDISWNYTSIGKSKRCPDPDGDGYFLPTSMRGVRRCFLLVFGLLTFSKKTKGDYTWYWEDDDNFSATLWYDGTSGQTWPLDLYSLDYDSKTKRKGTQRNDDGFVYCITCY